MPNLIVLAIAFTAVYANYDEFYFSSNASCPALPFKCSTPISVCAHEGLLKKFYCCGCNGGVCWTQGQTCGGENGTPAGDQLQCGYW